MLEKVLEFINAHWPMLVTMLVICFGVLFLVITLIVDAKSQKKYDDLISDQRNSVRIFVLDLGKNVVTYFNVNSPSKRKQETLDKFYCHFPSSEQKKIVNWIDALMDPNSEPSDFLEIDVSDTSDKKQYFSMLQVESVDRKLQVIHLQSYLFKYMASSQKSSSGVNYHGLSTIKEFTKAIDGKGKKKGVSAVFRFQYKKTQNKEREIDPLVFTQLKNVLSSLMGKNSFLIACSGNELLVADMDITEQAKCQFFVSKGLTLVNRFLSLNALSSQIECRCGTVEHCLYPSDANALIAAVRKMAEIAYEENQQVVWYEKGKENKTITDDSKYRSEVERIINEKKLAYSFRLIYSVDKGKSIGYFGKVEPKDTYFETMAELKDYATKIQSDKELFLTVIKNMVPMFVSMRHSPEEKLFFPIGVEEKGFLLSVFSRVGKAKEANLVLVFDEGDIRGHMDPGNPASSADEITSIKAKGFEVALNLDKAELSLPSSSYEIFDYFICSFGNSGSGAEVDQRIRAKLHTLVEKLLKYRKPIIANDVQGWGPIEILVRSGLRYISSDDFSPYEAMIVSSLPPKSVRRVNDMKK